MRLIYYIPAILLGKSLQGCGDSSLQSAPTNANSAEGTAGTTSDNTPSITLMESLVVADSGAAIVKSKKKKPVVQPTPAQLPPRQPPAQMEFPYTRADWNNRGIRGISNQGNMCFMSSALQLLLHAAPLRRLMEESLPLFQTGQFTLAYADLVELFNQQWGSHYVENQPMTIRDNVYASILALASRNMLRSGQQADSGEFLSLILSIINREFAGHVRAAIGSNPIEKIFRIEAQKHAPHAESHNCVASHATFEMDSMVTEIFLTTETMAEILTPQQADRITNGQPVIFSLGYLFDHSFFSRHDFTHFRYCHLCGQPVDQTSGIEISVEHFPEILTISIKREAGSIFDNFVRPEMQIEFNRDGDRAVNGGHVRDGVIYDLTGFIVHVPGHYYAYSRHPDTGIWYEFNDSRVNRIDPSQNPINYARQVSNTARPLIFMYQKQQAPTVVPDYLTRIDSAITAAAVAATSAPSSGQPSGSLSGSPSAQPSGQPSGSPIGSPPGSQSGQPSGARTNSP